MGAHHGAPVAFKRSGIRIHQRRRRRIQRCVVGQFAGAALPCKRDAPCVKAYPQFAEILRGSFGRDHQNGLSAGGMLHDGVGAFRRIFPQIAVRVPAHDDVHAVHAAGQPPVGGQTQMRQSHDVAYSSFFQFPHSM